MREKPRKKNEEKLKQHAWQKSAKGMGVSRKVVAQHVRRRPWTMPLGEADTFHQEEEAKVAAVVTAIATVGSVIVDIPVAVDTKVDLEVIAGEAMVIGIEVVAMATEIEIAEVTVAVVVTLQEVELAAAGEDKNPEPVFGLVNEFLQ